MAVQKVVVNNVHLEVAWQCVGEPLGVLLYLGVHVDAGGVPQLAHLVRGRGRDFSARKSSY